MTSHTSTLPSNGIITKQYKTSGDRFTKSLTKCTDRQFI